jgi:hypothetical protein
LANANFHRGRNTKDTVTVVKERKKEEEEEDRAWAVLSSSSSTAEDPPLFSFGPLSIFKLWSAHFIFIYFSYSRCSLFCGCRFMCIEEEKEEKEEEMSSTAKDPPWS